MNCILLASLSLSLCSHFGGQGTPAVNSCLALLSIARELPEEHKLFKKERCKYLCPFLSSGKQWHWLQRQQSPSTIILTQLGMLAGAFCPHSRECMKSPARIETQIRWTLSCLTAPANGAGADISKCTKAANVWY